MTAAELFELIRNGEDSTLVYKRDDVRNLQSSGQLHYGLKPVSGADLDALDRRRLRNYLAGVLDGTVPPDDDTVEWDTLLPNLDLMVVSAGRSVATIDGLLLFGLTPNRYLPQAGIRAIFSDWIEIQSPGCLPNTVTPEGTKAGVRYARNQTLVNVMRDYGYVDARGMGVRNKIIPGMRAHNDTEPDLIAEEHRFTVRLWKERPADGPPC